MSEGTDPNDAEADLKDILDQQAGLDAWYLKAMADAARDEEEHGSVAGAFGVVGAKDVMDQRRSAIRNHWTQDSAVLEGRWMQAMMDSVTPKDAARVDTRRMDPAVDAEVDRQRARAIDAWNAAVDHADERTAARYNVNQLEALRKDARSVRSCSGSGGKHRRWLCEIANEVIRKEPSYKNMWHGVITKAEGDEILKDALLADWLRRRLRKTKGADEEESVTEACKAPGKVRLCATVRDVHRAVKEGLITKEAADAILSEFLLSNRRSTFPVRSRLRAAELLKVGAITSKQLGPMLKKEEEGVITGEELRAMLEVMEQAETETGHGIKPSKRKRKTRKRKRKRKMKSKTKNKGPDRPLH